MSALRRILLKRNCFSFTGSVCGQRNLSDNPDVNTHILRSESSDVEIPRVTIPEFFYSEVESRKLYRHTATVCAETGRSYTFEQLRVRARNLSKALRKIVKLENRDTIAILLPNVPEFPICALGSLEAGLIITTINPLYTPDEISKQLLDSSAKGIITLVDLYETAKSASHLTKKTLPIITIKAKKNESIPDGAISFTELTDTNIDIPDIAAGNPSDIAVLPYSSGTTGLPKGVELTHLNIVSNICQMLSPDVSHILPATDTFQEIIPAVLPMFHIYGFTVLSLSTLIVGGKLVTLRKFAPDVYISVLKNYNVTSVIAAPPLVLFLTVHPDVKSEYLQSVRLVVSGAAPLGSLDEERFLEKIGRPVHMLQGYGLTETSPVVLTSTIKLSKKYNTVGSVGKLIPNTFAKIIAVDDITGTPLGPNQSGELLVKGPQVMRGYHNKPEETKNAFLDGWFRTGDLMHYNEDGLFYVTDRLKELIKVKGFQVAPAELEEVIRDFPSVQDAAVIGVSHPIYGEVPRAYVVPKAKAQLKTEELQKYIANKLTEYKQLKGGVEIVESIPKNAAGKILRRQLKLQYQARN